MSFFPSQDYPTSRLSITSPADDSGVLAEIDSLSRANGYGPASPLINRIHSDALRLFAGKYPGYQACSTPYHDREHTLGVVLTAARLAHGYSVSVVTLPAETFVTAIIGAYFHDIGLLLQDGEAGGTGAKYTIGHEARSMRFASSYLKDAGCSAAFIARVSNVIECTCLATTPANISFQDRSTRTAGCIVGTADLLAQIADRRYLEKLPLLVEEFTEAGISGYDSPISIFQKTQGFYSQIVVPRLENDFGDIKRFMRGYFKDRHGIAHNLYEQSIEKNLRHLQELNTSCGDSLDCFLRRLRRTEGSPATPLGMT